MTRPIVIDVPTFHDSEEPEFRISQEDDGTGLFLTIVTHDPTVEMTIRCLDGGAAEGLAHALSEAAKEAKMIADSGWPDQDGDGFIGQEMDGHRPWYVRLEGVTYPQRFDDREAAVLHLAERMVESGCFPACWEHNEWQNGGDSIDDEVRALHDEGGDQMLPFDFQGDQGPGQLADDTEIDVAGVVTDDLVPGVVFRDWGQHGIAWQFDLAWDHDRLIFLTPRGDVTVRDSEEDA